MGKLIFFLVVIGFSVMQSIIKAANEKAKERERLAQAGQPGRKHRVQSEIESFLQEVTGNPVQKERPRQGDSQRTKQRRERRRQEAGTRKQQGEEQRRQQAAKARTKSKARTPVTSKRPVGSGISEHVDQYIGQHVNDYMDHDVKEYVETSIVDSVDSHLGQRSLEMPASTQKKRPAASPVAALLKNPEGIRNAILVNEILSRPRALRK